MQICIFEDTAYTNFLPLTYFRPVYDLRCGVRALREKIESLCSPRAKKVLHVRANLAEYTSEQFPDNAVNNLAADDTWFVNGRVLAEGELRSLLRKSLKEPMVFCAGDDVAAAFIPRNEIPRVSQSITDGEPLSQSIFSLFPSEPFPGRLVNFPWDLIQQTAGEIELDFGRMKASGKILGKIYPGAHCLNKKNITIGNGSFVKPGAVLDAEKGPIVIGSHVIIMPNAFIEGPAFVGDHSVIKVGAKIYHGTSIGKWCKVGGEVDASIIQSYSNKQHDGFLGHSYLGNWVNLGADTNTSDLKNTYGTIKMHVNGALVDSGVQFLGLVMGDHSKSGINVMFDTGTVVGVCCNVYGAGLPPKFVPSFSWGSERKYTVYDLEKSLGTARRVMLRRNIVASPAYEKLYRTVFTATERDRLASGVVE